MASEEQRRQWHLDKTFSLSHLISTIAAISALLVMGSKFDTRVTILEQGLAMQKTEVAEVKQTIKENLHDMSAKLDRLIERMPTK